MDASVARSAFDEAAEVLYASERLLTECSEALGSRLSEPRAWAAQEMLWWRSAFAAAMRQVNAAVERERETEAELENVRTALRIATGKFRLLEGLLRTARRRAAIEAETRALVAVEHIRTISELQR